MEETTGEPGSAATEQPDSSGAEFVFDEAARALLAAWQPGAAPAAISEAWLRERIAALGYGDLRYLPAAASTLIKSVQAGQPIAGLRIAECVDASFSITIAADGSSAHLDSEAAAGGLPLDEKTIRQALTTHGIVKGIDEAALKEALGGESRRNLVIARARPPVHGDDGRLELLLAKARDRRPQVDESGRIDYRELGEICVVHPGDALMRRHPPGYGEAGIDVFGKPIAPRPGKNAMFASNLSGSATAPDDPDLLVAAITGMPIELVGGVAVEPVFSVPAVNTASGNIRFDGTVHIKGDVAAGMSVVASGDIEVEGMVEAATLDAGGNVIIKGGVIGDLGRKEKRGSHIVRCGASFTATYAQQARIEAGDSIFIDDSAVQCELIARNSIVAGRSKRGLIIGGLAQAALAVDGKVFGSPNRVLTRIEIGSDPSLLKMVHLAAKERDAKETQLLEISKLLELARQNPGRIPPEKIKLALATANGLNDEIATLRERENELTQRLEVAQEARATAREVMYEGVEIHMGSLTYRVGSDYPTCAIGLWNGKLGVVDVAVGAS